MKNKVAKNILLFVGLILFVIILVYTLIYVQNPIKTDTDTSAVRIDDDMIIVPEPDVVKKDKFVDNILNIFGLQTIEDDEIPLATSSYNAKDVGMVPNDPSKALLNANQIIKVLNSSGKIVIDDKYYVTTPSEKLITGNIEITGTDNAELVVSNEYSSKLFDTSTIKTISVNNLTFENENSKSAFLIVYNDKKSGSKVEKVDVRSCTFNGNISLYRQYGDINLDPDTFDFGIDKFVFENNTVMNTKFSFIVLADIPVEYCEIVGNRIQNFTHSFINISITNETVNSVKLYNHISFLKVDSNTVICDDNWWGDDESGLYYTFVSFEGYEVLYNNNYVEGMKTRTNYAVYDSYLNSNIVNYTNNTWKNNICFAPNKSNNTLLKSKEGGSVSLTRNYSGNSFIVEESFAERVGQSKENLFIDFISLTQHADTYNISNNTFDIYDLRFPESSLSISDYSLSNNIIKARKASGNLSLIRMEDGYTVDSINICDNIIDIELLEGSSFNVVKMVDARESTKDIASKIYVRNNKITAPIGYIFYNVISEDLEFTNNTISITGSKYSGMAYKGGFTKSNISNNIIEAGNALT